MLENICIFKDDDTMLRKNKYQVFIGGLTFAVLTVLTQLTLRQFHFSALIETTIYFGLMMGSPLLWLLFTIIDRVHYHSQYWIIFTSLSFAIYGFIYGYFISKKQPNITQLIIKLCILFVATLIGLSTIAVSLFLFSDHKIS